MMWQRINCQFVILIILSIISIICSENKGPWVILALFLYPFCMWRGSCRGRIQVGGAIYIVTCKIKKIKTCVQCNRCVTFIHLNHVLLHIDKKIPLQIHLQIQQRYVKPMSIIGNTKWTVVVDNVFVYKTQCLYIMLKIK